MLLKKVYCRLCLETFTVSMHLEEAHQAFLNLVHLTPQQYILLLCRQL